MTISVVVPVYNGEKFLAEALQSLFRQTRLPDEIIVVNDGSTDGTNKVLDAFKDKIRAIAIEHSGAPSARNHGIRAAKGEFVGFLDADDIWDDRKLEIQFRLLAENTGVQAVVGFSRYFYDHTVQDAALTMDFVCSLFRRQVFDEIGLLNMDFRMCDDWDWFLRAREKNIPILIHSDVVRFYRRHNANLSNDKPVMLGHMMRVLQQSLHRRREDSTGTRTLSSIANYFEKKESKL